VTGWPTSCCAITIQQNLQTYGRDNADRRIRVRIGLHHGEAVHRDGTLYGQAVHAASRVMSEAVGGQILVTAAAVRGRVFELDLVERQGPRARPPRHAELAAALPGR
jgi:class 3 adenylate cyclase